MFKAKWVWAVLIMAIFAVSLLGCATASKKTAEQDLKDRLSSCEAQLQEKDSEISNLRDALASVIQEKESLAQTKVATSKPSTKDIQMALKNAGFDPGAIDGKMGKKTKEAIMAFQKANGLTADGKVGEKTWALLSIYLEKKVK